SSLSFFVIDPSSSSLADQRRWARVAGGGDGAARPERAGALAGNRGGALRAAGLPRPRRLGRGRAGGERVDGQGIERQLLLAGHPPPPSRCPDDDEGRAPSRSAPPDPLRHAGERKLGFAVKS